MSTNSCQPRVSLFIPFPCLHGLHRVYMELPLRKSKCVWASWAMQCGQMAWSNSPREPWHKDQLPSHGVKTKFAALQARIVVEGQGLQSNSISACLILSGCTQLVFGCGFSVLRWFKAPQMPSNYQQGMTGHNSGIQVFISLRRISWFPDPSNFLEMFWDVVSKKIVLSCFITSL